VVHANWQFRLTSHGVRAFSGSNATSDSEPWHAGDRGVCIIFQSGGTLKECRKRLTPNQYRLKQGRTA